jgi:hypothetical protein
MRRKIPFSELYSDTHVKIPHLRSNNHQSPIKTSTSPIYVSIELETLLKPHPDVPPIRATLDQIQQHHTQTNLPLCLNI